MLAPLAEPRRAGAEGGECCSASRRRPLHQQLPTSPAPHQNGPMLPRHWSRTASHRRHRGASPWPGPAMRRQSLGPPTPCTSPASRQGYASRLGEKSVGGIKEREDRYACEIREREGLPPINKMDTHAPLVLDSAATGFRFF